MVSMKKIGLISVTLAVAAIMMLSGVGMMLYNGVGSANAPSHAASNVSSKSTASPVNSLTAWTPGTTTMNEPGYTGGVYKVASTINIGHMNIIKQTSLYAGLLTDEIYDSPYQELPNGTYIPWLANSCVETNTSSLSNHTTFDPLTDSWQTYNLSYTLHIVPGVRWSDWTPANAASTYTYSNTQTYYTASGTPYTHTYSKYSSTKMLTYEVQSADFIISWELLIQSSDYNTEYSNVVNVIPVNNLTVEYLLSSTSATFTTYTRETPILPYHIWSSHIYADAAGDWNYKPTMPAGSGYNDWELGYTASTGFASGYVGTGPFMMVNGYNSTQGYYIANKGWELYVNPYYFIQYTTSSTYAQFTANNSWATPNLWRQYTPKILAVEYPYYSTLSGAVTAMSEGLVQTITEGVTPSFVPVVDTFANTYIFHKASSGYGFMQLNSYASQAPMNITAFRQALNYGTDKAYLATVIDSGYDILGQPIIPPSDPLWRNDSTPTYSYNPAKAESLIGGIPGMKNVSGNWQYYGKPVSADIQITSAGPNPLGVEGALVIAQEWSSIGVPTTVTQESFTTLIPNLENYNYNVISLGITGIAGDPTGDYFAFYNYNLGNGTGFYLGPWSTITYAGKTLTGAQVNDTMNNLTLELNSISNLVTRIGISDEIQGIAAIESTMINLGYGIDILPFTNTTFKNISEVNIPYASYMYWAVLTTHTGAKIVTHYTSKYNVSVKTSNTTYYNGQTGSVTVTVTSNLTGAAVAGANVTVGVSPSGATINITNNTGVTNSAGQYVWKFTVLNTQPLIYTNQYFGRLNFTAVASGGPSVEPGLGSALANVLPEGLKVLTAPTPTLSGTSKQLYWMKFENSSSGKPIANFSYTIQVASGAIIMTPAYAGEVETNTSSYNAFIGAPYYAVNDIKDPSNANMSSLTGKTSLNGTVYFWIQANKDYNYSAYGSQGLTYIFLGDMAQGTPVSGAADYMLPAEWTTSTNANGYGLQQPVEYPVQMVSGTPSVSVKLTVSNSNVSYDGTITVTANVTNATGKPVSGYMVQLESQNVLGANRGYFVNASGKVVLATNPNYEFGSSYLPAIDLFTGSNGLASATFSPGFYAYNTPSLTLEAALVGVPYGDHALVPYDSFIVTAMGMGTGSLSMPMSSVSVYSNQSISSLYQLNITDTNLAKNATWTATLSNGLSQTTNLSYVDFMVPNGTYSYSVRSQFNSYYLNTSAGTATVSGANASARTTTTTTEYLVTFNEMGIGNLTTWYITLPDMPAMSSTAYYDMSNASMNVTSMSVFLGNGKYNYTAASQNPIYAPVNMTSNFTVNNKPVNVSVEYYLVTYSVTITETGLPAGTMWSVNLTNGTNYTSTSSSLTFKAPNGTYDYTLYTSAANYIGASGNFTVNGAPVSKAVTFDYSYVVTFTETGLPAGTSWSVTVNGSKLSSTTSTISLREINGTYSYTVAGVPGYMLASYSGSFTVKGASVSITLSFTQVVYTVTLTETGLPSGTSWSVTFANGTVLNSTSTTISFTEPNGTYSVAVNTTNSNYKANSTSVSFTVSGSALSVSVGFHSVVKPTNNTLLYVVIGVVVAVVVIAAVVGLMMRKKKPSAGQ